MGVSRSPSLVNKKRFIYKSVCLYSVFEPGWDLGDTPCPGNPSLVGSRSFHQLVEGQLASRCKVALTLTVQVLVYCLKVYPLPTVEVWLPCRWLCVYLWDRALKPVHPPDGEVLPVSWSEVLPSSLVDFPLNIHRIGPGALFWLRPV